MALGGMWWALRLFPGTILAVSAATFAAEWRTQATRALLTGDGRLMVRTPRRTREVDVRRASRVEVVTSGADPDSWDA